MPPMAAFLINIFSLAVAFIAPSSAAKVDEPKAQRAVERPTTLRKYFSFICHGIVSPAAFGRDRIEAHGRFEKCSRPRDKTVVVSEEFRAHYLVVTVRMGRTEVWRCECIFWRVRVDGEQTTANAPS